MKCLGILGGMSCESTAHYYEGINEGIKQKLGGLHSGEISLYSVDFAPIEAMQRSGEFEKTGEILAHHAKNLEASGAKAIILATNTMHKIAPQIQNAINVPFLHIADATSKEIKRQKIDHVLLLGTRFTMQEDFYKKRLEKADIKVSIPDLKTCETIDKIIFEELCLGKINKSSKEFYLKTIEHMASEDKSIKGVILGCTEIGMLIGKKDTNLTLFDTTELHVKEAVEFMVS